MLSVIVCSLSLLLAACMPQSPKARITLYSGRSQHLLQPLLDRFSEDTGIEVQVRYGGTSEMAATILEEGNRSPADVFFAQDAGALGALAAAGIFRPLPPELTNRVDARFRSPDHLWVGLSGRARVIAYNTHAVSPDELPASIDDLRDPRWRERIGWAPLNASFQAFVTALRVERGEEGAREWLMAVAANRPRVYARNTAILNAVAAGEVDLGLVNHYYLHTMQAERGGSLPVKNHTPPAGTLVNVAGAGILRTTTRFAEAEQLLSYLLSEPAQRYFSDETYEYPLAEGVPASPLLPDLVEIPVPALDLNRLEDLDGTLRLLQELGIL